MFLVRKPGLKYVNRAEQSAYDFSESTLIQDSAWHTLSLAAIVPANAKLVLLRVRAVHDNAGAYFRISKVGQTGFYSCANVVTQTSHIIKEQTALVDCTGQQIQYWAESVAFLNVRIVVLGWFL